MTCLLYREHSKIDTFLRLQLLLIPTLVVDGMMLRKLKLVMIRGLNFNSLLECININISSRY